MTDRIPILAKPGDTEQLPIGYVTLSDEARSALTNQLVNGTEYHLGFWINDPQGDPQLRAVWFCPDPCTPRTPLNDEPKFVSKGGRYPWGIPTDGAEPPPTSPGSAHTAQEIADAHVKSTDVEKKPWDPCWCTGG